MRKNAVTRSAVKDELWHEFLVGCAESFADATYCPKGPHEELKCGDGTSTFAPKLVKWKCAEGGCYSSGIEKLLMSQVVSCHAMT